MKQPNVISIADATVTKRQSPADRIIEALEGDYMTVKQMAARYGVHPETIRRLIKATDKEGERRVTAPSAAVQQGGLVIYLFTTDDVAEMDAYMAKRGYVKGLRGEGDQDTGAARG